MKGKQANAEFTDDTGGKRGLWRARQGGSARQVRPGSGALVPF